jgi:hypothetical protein
MKKGVVFANEVDGKISMSPTKSKDSFTLNDALRRGYIDIQRGLYMHPKTGKLYTVDEAVRAGMLTSPSADPFEYSSPKEDSTTVSFQQALQTGNINPKNGQFGGKDRNTPMSIEEALQRQFLSPITRQNTQMGGSVVLLKASPHSTERGAVVYTDIVDTKIPTDKVHFDEQVTMTTTIVPDKNDDKVSDVTMTISEALKSGKIDRRTGKYLYPNTGEIMSVDEALICGFLSLDEPEEIDVEIHRSIDQSPMSLADAIKLGRIESDTATYIDPQLGEVMSLQKALQIGFIQPKVTSDTDTTKSSPTDQYTMVKEGSPFSPKVDVKVIDGEIVSKTSTEVQITSGEATYVTKPGFMVDSKGKVINTSTGDKMSLSEAASKGLLFTESTQSKTELRLAQGDMSQSLSEQEIKFDTVVPGSTTFIAKPGFKLDTDGKVVNTSNGSKMSLPEALAKGIVFNQSTESSDDISFTRVPFSSGQQSSATFTPKPGFKVSPKGKVVHTSTGDQISLQVAMAEGLVFIQSTEDKKDLPEQQTVFGAVTYMTKPGFKVDSKGKVTNKNTGKTMPLSEALVKGVVFSHSTDDAGKLVQPSGKPHSSDSPTFVAKPGFNVNSSGNVINISTGDVMSLPGALEKGLVFTETVGSDRDLRLVEGDLVPSTQQQQMSPVKLRSHGKPVNGTSMDHKADELDSRVTARTSGGRSADRSTPFDEVSHIITQYMYINAFDGVMVCISFIVGREGV